MLEVLAGRQAQAVCEGYPALRVSADMSWAIRPSAAGEELVAFETAVRRSFADGRLAMLCQYDRDRFDAVTLAVAARAHTATVAAVVYHDDVLLRVCRQYRPPGIRISGELDYRHHEVVERALGESLRLDRNVHVNLARLDYIDGACAATVVRAALTLAASRRMTVVCRPLVATVLDLVGAGTVPRLQVRPADETI
jgi:anti-anti-sigma regulatory factor